MIYFCRRASCLTTNLLKSTEDDLVGGRKILLRRFDRDIREIPKKMKRFTRLPRVGIVALALALWRRSSTEVAQVVSQC